MAALSMNNRTKTSLSMNKPILSIDKRYPPVVCNMYDDMERRFHESPYTDGQPPEKSSLLTPNCFWSSEYPIRVSTY